MCAVRGRWHGSRPATWLKPPMPPVPLIRMRGGWDSASTSSPSITCARWPGLALERRDLDAAEQLTEQALSISERGRPVFEFLALLERAGIWAARKQVRDALATVEAARRILAGTRSVLLARADELEALLRLSLGDLQVPRRAGRRRCPPPAAACCRPGSRSPRVTTTRRRNTCTSPSLDDLTPRRALIRQILLAAAAIERRRPHGRRHPGRRAGSSPPRGLP